MNMFYNVPRLARHFTFMLSDLQAFFKVRHDFPNIILLLLWQFRKRRHKNLVHPRFEPTRIWKMFIVFHYGLRLSVYQGSPDKEDVNTRPVQILLYTISYSLIKQFSQSLMFPVNLHMKTIQISFS